jgi:shikimate dehydrogenase
MTGESPGQPDRYAVIGNPIAHSLSPEIHARFARDCGQALVYERLLAPVDGFAAAVAAFRAAGGRGLNVTVPFKREAAALADRPSERVRQAGAANTLGFDAQGVWADNTDGLGLVADLRGRLGIALEGARLVLLGGGGAARGVVGPLLAAGVERLTVVARRPGQAAELVAAFRDSRLESGGFDLLGRLRADIVVNATSAGLSDDSLPIPAAFWPDVRLAYDMVYGARPTRFMRDALAAGCAEASDGLGMLVEQAAESFAMWRGVRPATAAVFAAIRADIDARG